MEMMMMMMRETTSAAVAYPPNFDEASMLQTMLFSDTLQDLKNLREQLYSAAEFFESTCTSDEQMDKVVLMEYAIDALVKTVDHLGSVTHRVNDLLDEQMDQISKTEVHVKSIHQQRVRTCQDLIDREGLFQQSFAIDTPKYHKRYILPVGETMRGAFRTKSKYQGYSLDEINEWHQYKNAIQDTLRCPSPFVVSKGRPSLPSLENVHQRKKVTFSSKLPNKNDLEWRPSKLNQYPLSYFGTMKPTTSSFLHPSPTHPTRWSITPTPTLRRKQVWKSDSVGIVKGGPEDCEHYRDKGKKLWRGLVNKYKAKKDNAQYNILDED